MREVLEEFERIGGADGVLNFLYRRHSLNAPLKTRGFRIQFHSDVNILYKDVAEYAAGLLEDSVEPVTEEKLRKPMDGINPLRPHGPN